MNAEQRRIWSKIFDDIDKENEEQILLERKIIEEERERNSNTIEYGEIQPRRYR